MCNFCNKTPRECCISVVRAISKARTDSNKGILDFDTNIHMALLEQGIVDNLVYTNFLANKLDILINAIEDHLVFVSCETDKLKNDPPKDLLGFKKLILMFEDEELAASQLTEELKYL